MAEATTGTTIGRHSLLKALNHRAVFEKLATDGPMSRVAIARSLTLSQASVSRIIENLREAGLVREGGHVLERPGRPRVLLDLNPDAATVAALDVRPGALRVHLADLRGAPLHVKLHLTRELDATATVDLCADALEAAYQEVAPDSPLLAVAIGVSGAWDTHGGRVYAAPRLPLLEGFDLGGALRQRLGKVVTLDNDVNLAAIGEHAFGAATGHSDFFYLNLGSGTGGGAFVNGNLYRGTQGFSGEIGNLPVRGPDGKLAPLESFVARSAVEARAHELGFEGEVRDFLPDASGARAETLAAEVGDYLIIGLAAIVTTFNPSLIVLGGSIGRHAAAWVPRLQRGLAELLPVVPELAITQIGEDAAVRGGAVLAVQRARQVLLDTRLGGTIRQFAR